MSCRPDYTPQCDSVSNCACEEKIKALTEQIRALTLRIQTLENQNNGGVLPANPLPTYVDCQGQGLANNASLVTCAEYQALTHELNDLKRQLDELKNTQPNDLSALNQQIDDLNRQINDLRNLVNQLNGLTGTPTANNDLIIKTLQQQNQDLLSQLEALKKEFADFKANNPSNSTDNDSTGAWTMRASGGYDHMHHENGSLIRRNPLQIFIEGVPNAKIDVLGSVNNSHVSFTGTTNEAGEVTITGGTYDEDNKGYVLVMRYSLQLIHNGKIVLVYNGTDS